MKEEAKIKEKYERTEDRNSFQSDDGRVMKGDT